MKEGYDKLVAGDLPADFPAGAELGEVMQTLRRQRRALLEYCDEAKDCQMNEPVEGVARQMEPIVQSLSGSLHQIDKAIPLLEKVRANLVRYPAVVAEVGDVILSERERA